MNCPHGMPSPASCTDCMDEGPVTRPRRWAKVAGPFPAQYDARCPCGNAIEVGERIQRWDHGRDGPTSYTHEGCRP